MGYRSYLPISILLALSIFPQTVPATELDDIKAKIIQMEERHQKEILLLKQQIDLLVKAQNTTISDAPSKPPEEQDTLRQRVENLEENIVEIYEDEDALEEDTDRTTITLYATLEYENFQNQTSTFNAKNVELFVKSAITDRLNIATEIEFEQTAQKSQDSRSGEGKVEQGWIEYVVNEYFKPRAGVILVPFGKYNLRHFDPQRDLTARPLVDVNVIPTTWAEAGAGFTGSTHFSSTQIDYQLYVVNGLTDKISDTGMHEAHGAFSQDNNVNKAIAGNITLQQGQFVELGLSLYRGKYDQSGHAITGINVDGLFKYGPLEFLGEYTHFNLDKGLNNLGQTVPEYMKGFYVQGNYRFWLESLNNTFLGEGFSTPAFTASIRYGQAKIGDDGDVGTGDNMEQRWTFGINYKPVESYIIKFEYQFNSTTNETLVKGNSNGFMTSVTAAF